MYLRWEVILLQDVSSIFRRYLKGLIVGRKSNFPPLIREVDDRPHVWYTAYGKSRTVAIIDSTRFVTTYVCPRRWWRCMRCNQANKNVGHAHTSGHIWAGVFIQPDTLAKWQNTRWCAILVHRGGLDARGWCGYWRGFYGRTELNIWVLGCRTQRG